MELTIEDIPIIIKVLSAKGDNKPRLIANKDKHLLTAKFTDNSYTALEIETCYYLENSTLRFTSDCYANISAHFQLQPTIEKYKKAAANSSNSKLLELIEKLTERVAALEAQISEK